MCHKKQNVTAKEPRSPQMKIWSIFDHTQSRYQREKQNIEDSNFLV